MFEVKTKTSLKFQEEENKKKDGTELWARKYAPQGYADLLSDDVS